MVLYLGLDITGSEAKAMCGMFWFLTICSVLTEIEICVNYDSHLTKLNMASRI